MVYPISGISKTKKIAIIGPESTGKTDLTIYLANHFGCPYVEEYARDYIAKLKRPYQRFDLLKIAQGQIRLEDQYTEDEGKLLICDTNLLVIKIWSNYKYGDCDGEILKMMASRNYNLLLLTYIDVPWEYDSQRENEDSRELLWSIYSKEVEASKIPYAVIKGSRVERQKIAVEVINKLLEQFQT